MCTSRGDGTKEIAQRFAVDEHFPRLPSSAFELGSRAIEVLHCRSCPNFVLTSDLTRNRRGTGHEAYVIVDGEAVVRRNGRDVTTFGPGDHFGELALLDGGPRTATVVASTPVRLLVLGQREFSGALDEVPGLAHKLMATMASLIRNMDEQAYG